MPEGFQYLPGFLDAAAAAALQQALAADAAWQEESLHLYGRRVPVPRLLAWCGDAGLNYRYSGADHPCTGWLPALDGLRRRLAEEIGVPGNMVLMNRYRNGNDYMGWHSDDERGLASRVVSVSLGATRRFLLRPPGAAQSVRLDLAHGSVLVMDGTIRHALPRTRRPVAERINLTFRRLEGRQA